MPVPAEVNLNPAENLLSIVQAPHSQRPPPLAVHLGRTTMRILLVEDEPRLAEAVASGLRADGFTVDVSGDGEDGLWRATEYSYDVIVLDIMLPKLSGYEVVKRLRATPLWTPVLVLTAKDGEYDEADALDLGADDYLTKPFSYVVLLAHLRALVRRGAPARPVVLSAGDLILDPATRRCHRGDTEIPLTAREFALLEYLLRRRNEVVSKAEILANVWDEFYDGDPNIVEVYIGYLRKKIDAPYARKCIETIRGAGYRLRGDGG
jgi:DNA-binding response OmpR family regulator